uniref:Aquaporin-like n=1 Tax=Ciona intestinalis TaxID=7719 RepID=F6YVW8_CIOIN|nr:aquaporin-like [Ciona intestinalis]|eukprot:XP_002128950.1 aquaporin-like [Ciona intestinalis]
MGNKKNEIQWKETPKGKIFFQLLLPLLAEFFTTFLHTFWGSMAGIPSTPTHFSALNRTVTTQEWAADYLLSGLVPAMQAGFAVWMLIVGFFKICVVHFNPAISVGFLVSGDLSFKLFLPYVIMQCMGAIFAAFIAQTLRGEMLVPFYISDDANIPAIFFCEVITTGIIIFYTLAMVVDKSYDQATGPLAIGMTVFQGILAGKWIGAGCLNPARWFGPAVMAGGKAWNYHWVLWVADCVGAAIFAVFYMSFFAPADRVWVMKIGTGNKTSSNKPEDQELVERKKEPSSPL